ncbi:hypothetical protein MKX01_013343 [Papaver californicum]|nr:hypothetical protein MKX01_013343 [Papaver californicum]
MNNVEVFMFNQQAIDKNHSLIFFSSSITKSPLKSPNFLTPILNFSRNLTPRQVSCPILFSHARVIYLSFNPSPRSFCSISSPHREIELNQKILSSSEEANGNNLCVSIPDSEANKLSESSHSYMVVFPYGSTVTFNMLDDEVDGYLEIIKRHASGLLETSKDRADGIIAAFTELPRGRWTIRSNIMRKKRMNQLVGNANSTLAELIIKVGLFDRSEITFREDPNYSQMLEYLKDQFEFNQKFVGLDFYLRLMERYIAFVGAEMERRIFVLGAGLFRIYGVLVYFFSPLIPALCSLVNYQAYSSSSDVHGNIKMEEDLTTSIPVRAYCLSQIDLMGLMTENEANLIPHTPGIGNYVILRCTDLTDCHTPAPESEANLLSRKSYSYMVVFKYGSTVMFNMLDHQVDGYLKIIKRHASGTTKDCGDSSHNYIDYEVSEKLKLPTCVQDGSNYMMLQNFNIDGICTIASVLGQSVVLDYYSRLVDELISEYTNVNIELEESVSTCNFKNLLELLWRTRADADIHFDFNLIFRSGVAWKEDSKYAHMFDHLRDEFKLTQRFADLDRKFKMVENCLLILDMCFILVSLLQLNIWFASDETNAPLLSVFFVAF